MDSYFVRSHIANQADILSTILLYISKKTKSKLILKVALNIAKYGNEIAESFEDVSAHTKALLILTLAEIHIELYFYDLAYLGIDELSPIIRTIEDPNQKARVLRKTGVLLRKIGKYVQSVKPSVQACFIKGSALGVRVKSFTALFICL